MRIASTGPVAMICTKAEGLGEEILGPIAQVSSKV
jgi:hypothetical protein